MSAISYNIEQTIPHFLLEVLRVRYSKLKICVIYLETIENYYKLNGSRKKSPPEKSPSEPKPNPIPNLTLTLPLILTGDSFPGRFFPDTSSVGEFLRNHKALRNYVILI